MSISQSVTTIPNQFTIYENVTFQITVENKGNLPGNDIEVLFPVPENMAFANVITSAGWYNLWSEKWYIPNLAAGESVTMTINLMPLQNPEAYILSSEIVQAFPEDVDSTPDNAATISEDDNWAISLFPAPAIMNLGGFGNGFSNSVTVFPNPAANQFTLQWNFSEEVLQTIRVYNLQWKVMKHNFITVENQENGFYKLDCREWNDGLYFIEFKTDKRVVTKKLLKQNGGF